MKPVASLWRGSWPVSARTFDVALTSALTILLLIETGADGRGFNPAALLLTVPLVWRRQEPMLVFGLVVLGAILDVTSAEYVGFTAILIAAYSVGAYARYRLLSLGVLLAVAYGIVRAYGGVLPPIPDVAGPFVILIPMWLLGNALRNWHLRVEALQERAALLELQQERATQAARTEERARMARELHDVVSHSVSVMVVQAGAARHVLQTSPEQATQALLAVEATGRETMTELRSMLGVLHDDSPDPALAPQPGIEELETLIRRVEDAGLPVELHVTGSPRPLPAAVDLTAYRVVQEALTNALKYAGLARTEVLLDYREAELKVEILDEGAGEPLRPGEEPGRGLAGMRERVALHGGRLEAGPRLERGYAVRAWLPLNGNQS